ncbi:DUF3658 domain-containing protein [Nocardia rhizosphaerae]|uniref:DUF3658 domain-containing protein n=1 Tax=Nocardia rhizosphaerae TaxID=1691571 RepID=A0ABV8LC65_9NOCA
MGLRVVTTAGLASVDEDFCDKALLEHIPVEPTPMTRAIADAMVSQPFPISDYVIHRRLIDLIRAGRVAVDGDPMLMGESRLSGVAQ